MNVRRVSQPTVEQREQIVGSLGTPDGDPTVTEIANLRDHTIDAGLIKLARKRPPKPNFFTTVEAITAIQGELVPMSAKLQGLRTK
ncbi:hypothetical protein J1614_005176 [Plenodomus biglobosus]|nr:hypothetical protein J1614_005176 [Plenodomus biglobosus]